MLIRWFLLMAFPLFAEYSIVFIHLGYSRRDIFPRRLRRRPFNPDCPIYLISEISYQPTDNELVGMNVKRLYIHFFKKSAAHNHFVRTSRLERRSLGGFWFYSSERFFYLEELIRQEGLTNVFHLENDVMLYRNLGELLPVFERKYAGMMAAPFEKDERCVPGLVYVSGLRPMEALVSFFKDRAEHSETDMEMIGKFDTIYHQIFIDHLPTVMPSYTAREGLRHAPADPAVYSNGYEEFQSVFDAAALGQYLGGIDPIPHAGNPYAARPGYESPLSVFDVAKLRLYWEVDEKGRRVPWMEFEGEKVRVNNLHIHSKQLEKFASL